MNVKTKNWTRRRGNKELVVRCGLAGCPVGGWAETAQAMRRIRDELPDGVDLYDVIDAMYYTDAMDRYRVRG